MNPFALDRRQSSRPLTAAARMATVLVAALMFVLAGPASAAMTSLRANGGCYVEGDALDVHVSQLDTSSPYLLRVRVGGDLTTSREVASDAAGQLDLKLRAKFLVDPKLDTSKGDLSLSGGAKRVYIRQLQSQVVTDPDDDGPGTFGWARSNYWVLRPYAVSAVEDESSKVARIRAWGLREGKAYHAHMLNKRGKYTGTTYRMAHDTSGGPCSWATPGYSVPKALRKWGTPLRAQVDASRKYRRGTPGRLISSGGAVLPLYSMAGQPLGD